MKRIRNVILPYHSYIVVDDQRQSVSSIRVMRNPKVEKFDISILYKGEIKKTIRVKDMSIRIFTDKKKKEDVIEFTDKKKKPLLDIHLDEIENKEIYKDYVKAMII